MDTAEFTPRATILSAPSMYGFPTETAHLLPWSFAETRLVGASNYWLATARPDGRPHVTPLWGVWIDNALYLDGYPTARWARNVARNPIASVNLESGADVVIVEGVIDDVVTNDELGQRIVTSWNAKYGRLAPEPSTRGIFRLRPLVARGWSQSNLSDGTRWEFQPDKT